MKCARVCAGVGLGILCKRGTGGTPDSAGTSHPRIYHSATVTAGQGTDVSVYPRATSDWPSLTLARAALPAQDRAWEDGGEGEKRGREMEKKLEDVQFAPKAHEQVSSFLSSLLHPPLKHLKLI